MRIIDKNDVTIKGKTMYFDLKESQIKKPHKGLIALIGCVKDYPEDFHQENGNYENSCCKCRCIFIGNKHRIECKQCKEKPQAIIIILEWVAVCFSVALLIYVVSYFTFFESLAL
ncbi:MAG: hypothetical protein V4440_03095 [Pseudomonadota bacterium]